MKPPEEVRLELLREWLAKADADLLASRYLVAGGAPYVVGAAFHAQQAAEKLLKSFLVWRQVEFPKTHDIEELLDLIAEFDSKLAAELSPATVLTSYAVETRYPGETPEPPLDQAKKALALAETVRAAVLRSLPAEFAGRQQSDKPTNG